MFDVYQNSFDEDGEWDDALAEEYCDGLMEEFAASPEGAAVAEEFQGLGWAHSFLYYGLSYVGCAPPEMSCVDVEEILFGIFPRKVSTEPDSACEIIGEMRAFWQFLHRQYALANATEILRDLTEDAEERLERELGDPKNFGMAKSLFTMGNKSGFDMTTQEGLDQFMFAYNASVAEQSMDAGLPESHSTMPSSSATPTPNATAPPLTSAERKAREKLRRKKFGKSKRRR